MTSGKAWNYTEPVQRQLVASIIFLRPFKRQETKIHKTWSFCQSQRDPKTILVDIWSSASSHCQLASSETHTTHSQKSWHSFAGTFSGSARVSLQHSTLIAQLSLVPIYCSTWRYLHEAIWLDATIVVLGTKNRIGCWPDYFSLPRGENSLGTRLVG